MMTKIFYFAIHLMKRLALVIQILEYHDEPKNNMAEAGLIDFTILTFRSNKGFKNIITQVNHLRLASILIFKQFLSAR